MKKQIIEKLIDEAQNSILSSIDEDGYPVCRAMLRFRKREGLKEFYFSTNKPTNKVKQFCENCKSSLYFFDKNKFIGCLFVGDVQLLDDMDSRKKVWLEGDELYYPGGIGDPDMIVLKFSTKKPLRIYSNFRTEEIQP